MKKEIEIIARGIIVKNEKILLCKVKTKPHWFFPGGHLEKGETIDAALQRELLEETGEEISEIQFIGINENTFSDKFGEHQEVNVVFRADINAEEVAAEEEHLEFQWAELKDLKNILVKPEGLRLAVLKWIKDEKVFYSFQ
jgi:8-oxo-dGTP diphosphatase